MEMHHAAGHGGGIDLLKSCMIILFMLAMIVFWIRMLISAIQNKGLEETEKIVWVGVIALTQLIGALIYFFIGHPKRKFPLDAGQRC